MDSKKVNRIFLAIIVIHIAVVAVFTAFSAVLRIEIITNFILGQMLILIPAAVGVLFAEENPFKLAEFHKIKISSVFMIILFTFLIMPLVVLINAVSMLFVDNTVAFVSGDIVGTPFIVMFLIIGLLGPLNEEMIFRGVVYQGYKRSGTVWQALLLSALLFALMHMNFNQAAYAFVMGILAVLLVEATGSIWSSILVHVVFNGEQVCLMYLVDKAMPGMNTIEETQAQLTTDAILMVISVYLIIAVFTTALAGCVLVWIAKNEKREEYLRAVWTTRKNKKESKLITIPFLLAVVLAFSYMILEVMVS